MIPASAALAFGSAAPASAAVTPVTTVGGGSSQITINNDHFHPGETIEISGSGFELDAMTTGNPGNAVLALKVNGDDFADFPWSLSGPSRVDPSLLPTSGGSTGYEAIEVVDGVFDADLTIPAGWDPEMDIALNFLGGTLSTAKPGKTLSAGGIQLGIDLLAPTEQVTTITSTAHTPGSSDSDRVQVKLRNYQASSGRTVAFKIDGAIQPDCITTDADGDWTGAVALGAAGSLSAGEHTLTVLAGSDCSAAKSAVSGTDRSFNVTTASLISTSHAVDGTVELRLDRFVRNASAGQKVAIKLSTTAGGPAEYSALDPKSSKDACIVTDRFGNANATVRIPDVAALAAATHVIVEAGTACGTVNPGRDGIVRSIALPITIGPAAALEFRAPAKFTGTARVGSTLTSGSVNLTRTSATAGYQWLRNGAPIKGATAKTYRAAAADANTRLSLRVIARVSGETVTATSGSVKVAPGSITLKSRPKFTGTAKVGKKLKANAGTWSQTGLKVSYTWLRNGKAIKGATKASYKLVKKDKKKKVTLKVTVAKPGYTAATATSLAKKIK